MIFVLIINDTVTFFFFFFLFTMLLEIDGLDTNPKNGINKKKKKKVISLFNQVSLDKLFKKLSLLKYSISSCFVI